MTEEEEWVKTAMSDDSIVVEMLLRLHQAEPRPAPRLAPRKKGAAPVLQLEWSVRQRRSRQKVRRKKGDATRASPTTPLSWSGATSVSGGAADGGFEESSKPSKPIDNARSKVVATGETTAAKRSRKKKVRDELHGMAWLSYDVGSTAYDALSTFRIDYLVDVFQNLETLAELKEEEGLLLKERRNLKNKLATLRLSFEQQRAENESLKRMKLDVLSQQSMEIVRASGSQEAILNQHYQMKVLCDPTRMILSTHGASTHGACNDVKPLPPHGSSEVEGGSNGSSFLLPDLNLPVDPDSGSGNLCGTGAMQLRLKNQIPSLATPRSIFKILKPEVSSNVSAANFAGNVCKQKTEMLCRTASRNQAASFEDALKGQRVSEQWVKERVQEATVARWRSYSGSQGRLCGVGGVGKVVY
ncbi:hypothetical protein WN943_022688 [Citrus x changshan-huyou]